MPNPISRPGQRRWLTKALPVGLAALLAVGATAGTALAATTPITLSLVPPTGHHQVGTVRLHLVDPTRTDPSVPTHPQREVMAQFWYPTTDADYTPTAPYLPPLAAAHFIATNAIPAGTILPATIGHIGAPADYSNGPRPVLLYSPGHNSDGSIDTALAEDLATHGYIVVALDVTFDSPEVEFPGGRLVVGNGGLPNGADREALRAADASFVLNELAILRNGRNPDAEHTPIPAGLGASLDLSRVGMFGWSNGGAAAAVAMNNDPRIKAGINLDGPYLGAEKDTGVTRPFLTFTGDDHPDAGDPSLASFQAASTGPKFRLNLAKVGHDSFSDVEEIAAELGEAIPGLDLTTAVNDQRVYIRSFFNRFLRNFDDHLLDGPSPLFPDVQFPTP